MTDSSLRDGAAGGPLAGLRIIEYGDLVTAPYAAKVLADLGATVIKLEPPRVGDRSRTVGPFPNDRPSPENSGLFTYLNAKKRGVTLDITCTSGQIILDELITGADVFIENVSPQDSARFSVDPERIRSVNGDLVHLSISPFGHSGPYSSDQGYGLNAAAMSGVVLGVGEPDRSPLPLPDFLDDFFTGVVGALSCMLALTAVDESHKNNDRGEWIDLSAAETWMTFQTGIGVVQWLFSGRRQMREGRQARGRPYPHTILRCKDGYVRLTANTAREWRRFVEVMGTPDWSRDERFQDRVKMSELYSDELDSLIEPWLLQHTKVELEEIFYESNVPFSPVKDFGDVLEDPQLLARNFFVAAEQSGIGTFKLPGPPYRFADQPLGPWLPAPRLGEHNYEVYHDGLHITPDELVALQQAGVI